MKTALVTGSSGLVGSEMVSFLDERGWRVHGVDNNMRRDFFGEHGDTTWNLERLRRETRRFEHHDLDVRGRDAEPARGGTGARARGAVRVPVDEQGLRRRPERARARGARDALGLRGR